jgi:hypothetical protein
MLHLSLQHCGDKDQYYKDKYEHQNPRPRWNHISRRKPVFTASFVTIMQGWSRLRIWMLYSSLQYCWDKGQYYKEKYATQDPD